jgi:putative endonuclease
MDAHVYILRCADGAYYVGSHRGEDVGNRVADHNNGVYPKAWTYRRRPVELVWSDYFPSVMDAIACERQLKGWTRAKKEALIRGDWAALRGLARSGTRRPSTSSGRGDFWRVEIECLEHRLRALEPPPRSHSTSS